MKQAVPDPQPVDLAAESVAGEEDPGASIELAVPQAAPSATALDTAASGDTVCPHCGGTGRLAGKSGRA